MRRLIESLTHDPSRVQLNEQSFPRNIVIRKIDDKHGKILEHLIKILMFRDPDSLAGHIRATDGWIKYLLRLRMKPDEDRPPEKMFYDSLYVYPVDGDLSVISDILKSFGSKYSKLEKIRSVEETMGELKKIYPLIARDLSTGDFKTIEKYLPDSSREDRDNEVKRGRKKR